MNEIDIVNNYKLNGDNEYKINNFSKALRNYYNGKIYIISLFPEFKPTNNNIVDSLNNKNKKNLNSENFKEILIKIMNNMSLIFLKQEKYQKCVVQLNELLLLDETNEKALFRKYTSLYKLKDYENSKIVIEKWINLFKNNDNYKNKLDELNRIINKENKNTFDKFKGFYK